MRISSDEPVKLECTMPNGSVVWLTYEQWQRTPANWTGGIIGHRDHIDILRAILQQSGGVDHG